MILFQKYIIDLWLISNPCLILTFNKYVETILRKNNNLTIRCTNRNDHDIVVLIINSKDFFIILMIRLTIWMINCNFFLPSMSIAIFPVQGHCDPLACHKLNENFSNNHDLLENSDELLFSFSLLSSSSSCKYKN